MAAVGVAALCGLAAAAARRDLSDHPFGWRHGLVGVVGVLLVLSFLAPLSRVVRSGRLGLAADKSRLAAVFLPDDEAGRVLWLGRPMSLPGDSYPLADVGGAYAISRGRADVGTILPPAPADADAALTATLRLIREGTTQRAGRLLAPFGVHWVVVVVDRGAARIDGTATDPNLIEALGRQLDLAAKRVDPSLLVFENTSVLIGPVVLDRPELRALVRAPDNALADALQATDVTGRLTRLAPSGRAASAGDVSAPDGAVVLVAERDDSSWEGSLDGRPLEHQRVFGWAQAFVLPPGSRGRVVLQPAGGGLRALAVLVQVVLWCAAIYLWRRRPAATPVDLSLSEVDDPTGDGPGSGAPDAREPVLVS
jgi:hypothetical protein